MKKDFSNSDSERRSIGVQNLLDKYPHWLILNGNFLISVMLLVFLLIVGYSVKYPDFINSKITINIPIKTVGTDKPIEGNLYIFSNNLDKVKVGQKVIIKLYDFQYEEFGILEGIVNNIWFYPNKQGKYKVNVILPNGVKTSFNKNISYDMEVKGDAKIITKNTNLIEHFILSK
jgi:hypothetical protein